MSTVRGCPPRGLCLAGGISGAMMAHCSSVRSEGYCFRAWSFFFIRAHSSAGGMCTNSLTNILFCQALFPDSLLGVIRKLNVAALIDTFCPPHPAHVLSCGRGVEALLLAILDGHHALYKVGARLEERGMLPLLQPGLTRTSLHDYRLGQILDGLFAVNLNRVFGALALQALEVYAVPTPWLHQDTTTLPLYGAYEEKPTTPGAPRPAYGHSKDGHDDLKQVLLSLGVSSEGL